MWRLLVRLRSRALDYGDLEAADLYPPSDPDELLATVEGKAFADKGHALYQLLRLTERVIYRARQRELKGYGISTEISSMLSAIVRLGSMATPKLIAEQRLVQRNATSDHLTRLEIKGLVRKVRDLGRKNRVRVVLTSKGEAALRDSAVRRSTNDIMQVLTREEQKTLWMLLSKLRAEALKALGRSGGTLYPPSNPEEMTTELEAFASATQG